tara:strand:- start:696 stop:1001 length:306 start_codon:yes stop_codon:yes gene_type:complete
MKKTDIKNFIEELYLIIERRAKASSKKSYTKKLLKKGPKTIAQKFGEESAELLIEYLSGSKKRTIEEAADVFYHLIVLLYSKKISLIEIKKELERRKKNVR